MMFTIFGIPRTKKTSNRIFRAGDRLRIMPSAAAKKWEREAIQQLRSRIASSGAIVGALYWHPVRVRALVYRDARRGDMVGFLQAIGDALERSGVIRNDRLIASWDGSRLLKDAANPRVELLVEAYHGERGTDENHE